MDDHVEDGAAGPVARPPDLKPPAQLEERIVRALRAEAALAPPPSRTSWKWWAGLAAGFAAGLLAGAGVVRSPSPADADGPRYMLLLYEGESAPTSRADEDASVSAHRAWLAALRQEGRTIGGERLSLESPAVIGGAGGDRLPPALGYFVTTARSREDAIDIARSNPHVKSGGRIVVQAIDTPR
jgi:hypothetical protein